jgi:hypothetical protein
MPLRIGSRDKTIVRISFIAKGCVRGAKGAGSLSPRAAAWMVPKERSG